MGFDPISIALMSSVGSAGISAGTLAGIGTALSVGSGVMGYVEQKKADRQAKSAANAEAAIMQQDAAKQAQQEKLTAKDAAARQRMLYLTSGVDLTGSPLLEVQRTARQGEKNADAVMQTATAKSNLVRQQGSMGRASLVGSALETGKAVMGNYMNYQLLKPQLQKKAV